MLVTWSSPTYYSTYRMREAEMSRSLLLAFLPACRLEKFIPHLNRLTRREHLGIVQSL